tara:strand:- start:2660 stop:3322 length:663 start_codon:yes stop_codon:yes gene_type:complete
MSKEPKKLVDLVAELDRSPVDKSELPHSPEDAPVVSDVVSKARALSSDDKKWQAFEWSMMGHDTKGIATMFDVSPSTIYRWLQDLYREHRQSMEQVPGVDVLSEHLLWLGRLEQICLHEINLMQEDSTSIDPDTGVVSRNDDSRLKSVRVKFLQAALRARQMKIEMLQKANVLPVEPEKIYHTMSDERRKVKEEEKAGVEKSREEIVQSIEKLISKGLSI